MATSVMGYMKRRPKSNQGGGVKGNALGPTRKRRAKSNQGGGMKGRSLQRRRRNSRSRSSSRRGY